VFAVFMLLNKRAGVPFDAADEQAAGELAASLGVILQTWHQAHRARRRDG
jgi:hypothetical protein